MKLTSKIFTATLLASTLAACGGGGGASGPVTDPVTDPTTDPVTDPVTDPTTDPVTGRSAALQVMYGKVADSNATPLANVMVNVNIFNGEQAPLIQFSTQTDINGNYELLLPEIKSEAPLQVTANFFKEGFSEGEKALNISDEQIALSIDAVLSKVMSVSVKRADLDTLAFGADGQPRLQLSLVKNQDGKQQLLVGGAHAAADTDTQLGLSIPSSSLPESIEVINGELAYFDSSDQNDIQNFPGEFIGSGETEQQGEGVSFLKNDTESEQYRLISSTFSQIKLTDQNGDLIELSDVKAADGTNPTITLQVPKGSYSTIEKDFDLSIDGIQIPIFVYKSSDGWQYVGNGLLVDVFGKPVGPTYPEDSPVDVAEDGGLSLADYTRRLYVSIEIVDANQWLKWINLDWPIKPSNEVSHICFNGSVNYNGGESYSGMTGVRLPDGGFKWVYIENGSFSLDSTFAANSEQVTNPANWNFSIRNVKTGLNEEMVLPETLETGENCNEVAISLFNPYQCQVKGKLFAADGITPLSKQTVRTLVNHSRATLVTDADGSYEESIACDESFSVSAFGQTKEQSVTFADNPVIVNFTKANQPPVLGISNNGSGVITEGETAKIKWSVSDPEGDAVDVSIASCMNGEKRCTWEQNASSATLTFPTYGNYKLVVRANDGHQEVTRSLSIDVKKIGNQAPKINGFELDGQFYDSNSSVDLVVGQKASLKVLAHDINGDQLSFQWQGIGCVANECSLDTSKAGEYPVVLTVNDNNQAEPLTSQANLTLVFAVDKAPEANLQLSSTAVSELNGFNAEAIRALLLASDDLTAQDKLAISWSLDRGEDNYSDKLQISDLFNVSIAAATLPVGEYQLSAKVTDINIQGEPGLSTHFSKTFVVTDDLPPSLFLKASAVQLFATENGTEQPLTVTATIADDVTPVEQLALNWTVLPKIAFTTSADNRSITIAANDLHAADYQISASLTDGNQQQVTSEYSISVLRDQPPEITSMTVTPVTQVESVTKTNRLPIKILLSAQDDLSDTPTVEWEVTPSVGFTASNTELNVAAGTVATGQYQVQAKITDHRGQVTHKTILFDITKRDGNVEIIID